MFGGKWINRIDNFSVWILLFLILLFIITGYGTTKNIMDPVLAKYIHTQLLPIPFFVFFLIHVLKSVYRQFKSWGLFKSERVLNGYVYLLGVIVAGLFIWLYFR